ncbi:hypothetical protein C6P45_000564 [Maudiozyma exigua]|uniref:PA14 domain-containing protein n=1 Tax=Maudiozyma exigua TaxID=34358 RepID=A0A9P6W708_MAUEX|nr:hypothetical protein C6P45_000564 [Kazachstania exigua]
MIHLRKLLLFVFFVMKAVVAQLPDCKMSYVAPTPPGFMYYIYETPLNGIPVLFDGLDPLQMVYRFYILGQPLYVGTTTHMAFELPTYINNETVVNGSLYGNPITVTNFSMVANGWIRVNETGNYTFTIDSDYAAAMYIFSDPRTLCLDTPLAGSYNYSSFYISSSVTQPNRQVLSGQVYLVAGVPYQMGLSYIHKWGAPKFSVSVIDTNGKYHPDFSYLLSTLNTYSNGVKPTLNYVEVNVTSVIGYSGVSTTLFSVTSNTNSVSDNGLTVTTTYYYHTPTTTTVSSLTVFNDSSTSTILVESSTISVAGNSSESPGGSESAISITAEISSLTTSADSTIDSSTSLLSSAVVSNEISDNSGFTVNGTIPRISFGASFTGSISLTSNENESSRAVDKISETVISRNSTSELESSLSHDVVHPTPLIFSNSSTNVILLESSLEITAIPKVQSMTDIDVMGEQNTSMESGANEQFIDTKDSTVTERITHTSFKISSLELSFIGLSTNSAPVSHSIETETDSGLEYVIIVLECPTCENGVTTITKQENNNGNAIATQSGAVFQITGHVPITPNTAIFVGVDYSKASIAGLNYLSTSIPVVDANKISSSSIDVYLNSGPPSTTNTVIQATNGVSRDQNTYLSSLFGVIIMYLIFPV